MCATHRDVRALDAEAGFRADLYYRISELLIEVPPLRERPGDASVLAQHFFDRYRERAPRPLRGLAPDAIAAIANHPWPGNVRELENRVKRAVALSEGPRASARDLDLAPAETEASGDSSPQTTLRDAERRAVAQAWAEADGNVTQASKLLGVSRPTLYNLLRDHGLKE